MIITIDGTSSSGKSTISRTLGSTLKFCTLNTGSIYRAITYKTILLNIDYKNDNRLKEMLKSTIIEIKFIDGKTVIKLDGLKQNLKQLSSPEVSSLTPKIACKPFVREYVRKIQRQMAADNDNIIVEGRDIGSVVFPKADFKFFIDADLITRAKRRFKDYQELGKDITLDKVISDLKERDKQDKHREQSPLIMTSNSILLDTSNKTIQECIDELLKIINKK